MPSPFISTPQRRARLVTRHHLDRSAAGVREAVTDLVAVHSTDPATPYLSLWARIPGFSTADLEDALYEERRLWRLHAMRRTLFVVGAEDQPVLDAACARKVAAAERRRLEAWLSNALPGADVEAHLAGVGREALDVLADGEPRSTAELARLVDGLELKLTVGSGRWTTQVPLSSRLLLLLAMEGRIARARPLGSWLSGQYRWADSSAWFGQAATRTLDPAEGRALLARTWLASHGPATTTDLRWWAGWTVRDTAAALSAVDAAQVEVESAGTAWVLPDDVDAVDEPEESVALLPSLDSTVMGWKERDWYVGPHASLLFDTAGNAGPTAWVNGRVVGGWGLKGAEVVLQLLEDVGADARERLDAEAAALTGWLAGTGPIPRFRTPLERQLSGAVKR